MTAAPSEIDLALVKLLEKSLERPVAEASFDTDLTDLGLDALAIAHFHYHVQRAFGRAVPRSATTLRAISDALEQQIRWKYPPPPSDSAVDLARGDFGKRFLRPPVHALVRLLMRLLFRFRVRGRHHIPKSGPFVLVANHNGHADAMSLVTALPISRVNDVHPLAAQDYFFKRKGLGATVHFLLNALPIDRHARADEAMRDALELLADGRGIILFPEGTRSETGEMSSFKKGVGLLLAGKPVPGIPAYITGSRDVLPKGASWPRFRQLRVVLGPPMEFQNVPDNREGWAAVALALEGHVRRLGDATA